MTALDEHLYSNGLLIFGFSRTCFDWRRMCKLDSTFAGRQTFRFAIFLHGLARQRFRICQADPIQFVISSESMS